MNQGLYKVTFTSTWALPGPLLSVYFSAQVGETASFSSIEPRYPTANDGESGAGMGIGITAYPDSFGSVPRHVGSETVGSIYYFGPPSSSGATTFLLNQSDIAGRFLMFDTFVDETSSTNYEPVIQPNTNFILLPPQSNTRTPCAGQWTRFPTPLSYYSALSTTNTSSATNLAPTETHGILRTSSQVPSSSNERAFSQSLSESAPQKRAQSSLVPSLKYPTPSSDPTIQQQKQPRTVHFAVPLLPASAKSRPASINSAPSYPASTSTPSTPISVAQTFTQFTSPPTECTQTSSSTRTYNSFWSSHGTNPVTSQASFSSIVEPRYATAKDGESGAGMGIGTGITAYPDSFGSAPRPVGSETVGSSYSFGPSSSSNSVYSADMTFPLNQSDIAGRA
ncbi:hypothetical protein BT96DRAFT_1026912 [Gymnopus androsaceus JB14]|uniref:Uncharacterized protein n=1 Tax=Gymnopus androsaceus JB14 TaxID=1447944 RepID=A0A6A4GFL0_9AGAR|nr:hypothetical protein BT96DRAFT_1026912 [Gymnopus androsaceus JB14]